MKQVIVVNEALRLPRGKLAAQVAHAAVDAYVRAPRDVQRRWLKEGMPKVVLRCETEDDLLELHAAATAAGLPTSLIRDAGHTVLEPGTITCAGIGPAAAADLEPLTGTLRLVR
jgi:peptidyl-tRNA hydrolase